VIRAVAGVSATEDLHSIRAYGLVDRDGMSDGRIADSALSGVYALPVVSVESLYYSPEVLSAVALRQAGTVEPDPNKQSALVQKYITEARMRGLAALRASEVAVHLASRLAERQLRDSIDSRIPTRSEIAAGGVLEMSLESPYSVERARLDDMLAREDFDAIIARYPIRETGALKAVANALKFQRRDDYEAAALARISSDRELLELVRNKLGPLAALLQSNMEPGQHEVSSSPPVIATSG
jgi:hypothetical protein